jgi:hypothetical protein
MREYHVRICEGLRVEFPGPTRQNRPTPERPACLHWPAPDIKPIWLGAEMGHGPPLALQKDQETSPQNQTRASDRDKLPHLAAFRG